MRNVYFQPQTKEIDLLPQTHLCDGLTIGSNGAQQSGAMAPRWSTSK